jgi:hypothetical protein
VLIAIYRPVDNLGFAFMTIAQIDSESVDTSSGEVCRIGDGSSIGMLYDTMTANARRQTVLTIPNEWDAPSFRVELAS